MPATELTSPPSLSDPGVVGQARRTDSPPVTLRRLSGFGRTLHTVAEVHRPVSTAELADLAVGATPGLARGGGCAYGDAALNDGGQVLDLRGLSGVLHLDAEAGRIRALGGTSLADLLRAVVPLGWTLPVLPGTTQATLGGAIAADVHGKNHHRDGALGAYVQRMRLVSPDGDREISPRDDRDGFRATVGGMGLTGTIADATLRLEPLPEPTLLVDTERTSSLEATLECLQAADTRRYTIGWLDLLGPRAARGVVTAADHARPAARPAAAPPPGTAVVAHSRLSVPWTPPTAIVRPPLVRAQNALRWRRTPRREVGRPQGLGTHLFPLDALRGWNRLYGPAGLVQYQFAVPRSAGDTLREVVDSVRAARLPVYLATLKRLGPAGEGWLSFPLEGWTLALDIPAGAPGLGPALDRLDERVASAGGRVYLAKDVRLRAELLAAMYPGVGAWREARARLDSAGRLRSDLGVRLGLCEAR